MVTDLTNGENSGMYKILSRKQLTVCGIPVALERKKIKTLRLSVTAPDGAVRVSAPVKISEEIIIDFISQKLPWIRKQQKRITENAGKVAVEADRQRLKELIEIILPKWEKQTGLNCFSWQIRNMKTRWGSCNTKTGRIWFSLQLAVRPIECIEYVVLHELIHLKIPGHGKDFKEMLDSYMEDWRVRRNELNGK